MEALMKIAETNIIDDMFTNLNSVRESLSDLENNHNTFDLDNDDVVTNNDLATNEIKKVKEKTKSQLKREELDVNTFKSTFNYYESKRRDDYFAKTGKEKKEMELIENLDEIDELDNGKTWKQLDNWLKQKKIREYAESNNPNNIENYQTKLIELFHKGEFRKTSQVTYDPKANKITELHSTLANLIK